MPESFFGGGIAVIGASMTERIESVFGWRLGDVSIDGDGPGALLVIGGYRHTRGGTGIRGAVLAYAGRNWHPR